MTDAHRHEPSAGDPNQCDHCRGPWYSIRHQPSLVLEALRTASGNGPAPEDLERYERASGAPFRPSGGIPATAPGPSYEFCDHPNGFGPYGCPCGASAPSEDDSLSVRNLETSKDVPATRCITCNDVFPDDQILVHLRDDELVGQADLDQMADMLGLPKLTPPAASPLAHLDLFFDPAITTEHFVSEIIDTPTNNVDALSPTQLEELLTDWWMDLAQQEVSRVVPKAVEYGALDLIQIGQDLALTAGRTVTDQEAAEMGIYFYIRGKLARWTDAIATGRQVSDDTLHDLGVYVRMAQRVRHSGGWPGLPKS